MALTFNYKGLLQLDAATYEAWTPTLEVWEQDAITTAKRLAGNDLIIDPVNDELRKYCNEVILLNAYGEGMSANIYKYHFQKIQEQEEVFRYGYGG